jgi:hypothetical protein
MGDQSVSRPLPNTDIDALSGIRTHDHSVRAGEDISCLRRRGHCDQNNYISILLFELCSGYRPSER